MNHIVRTRLFCSLAMLALGTLAHAEPNVYTRGTTYGLDWNDPSAWTNNAGYPGADPGDTAVFSGSSTRTVMNANQLLDSVIVTNTGSWQWRHTDPTILSVSTLFLYTSSGTSYFGDVLGQADNSIAALGGTCKVVVEKGTLHLMSPYNAYSGGTEINGGVLWANVNRRTESANTFLGSGPINLGATNGPDRNVELWVSHNGAITYSQAITNRAGNSGLTILGRGTLTGAQGGLITLSGELTLQKAIEIHSTCIERTTWTTTYYSGVLNLSGGISGSGNVTKDGISWVRVSGVGSYTGDTTVRHGLLTLENSGNTMQGNYAVLCGLLMASSDARLGHTDNTLTLGADGTFGGFGPYNALATFDREITLAGNGGFLQSQNNGSYRQVGTGIISGPGKLIVAVINGAQFTNNNSYAGGTIIVDGTADSAHGSVNDNNLFGTGDIAVHYNSALNLRGNGNVANGRSVRVTRTGATATGTRAALRLYAGVTTVPVIDPLSDGLLLLNASSSTALNNLVATSSPQVGNGYMLIGSDGYTFSGASLQANLDDVYRLGARNGTITLDAAGSDGVLTGARDLEVGQLPECPYVYVGTRIDRRGGVRTLDANDYTGTTTVYQDSLFRGTAQTVVDTSPFGDTNAPVVLLGGGIYLDGAGAAQPVSKGDLTVDGYGQVSLSSAALGNELTFASLNRVGSSVLYFYAPASVLGSPQAVVKIHSGIPATENNMLPPYFLNAYGGFMDYGVNGFTNAVFTHTNLTGVDNTSIVNLAGGGTISGTVNVYALRSGGVLAGTATDSLVIHGGGLISAANVIHTAPISFGAEAVILDANNCTLSGKLTGSSGLVKMGGGITILNANNSTTLSGPITINQGTLRLNVAGAVAPASTIKLNGGYLSSRANGITWNNPIELGTLGGALGVENSNQSTFAGNITGGAGTGPLTLMGFTTTLTGTGNTYQGGTIIPPAATKVIVSSASSLGTGDVMVDGAADMFGQTTLELQGDANISPTARLFLNGAAARVDFLCPAPVIGSLEGYGEVRLAGSQDGSGNQALNCILTVGGNNLDTDYFGCLRDRTTYRNIAIPSRNQLIKVGTGSLTLWGENSYSGGTTISEGTLVVNNWLNPEGDVTIGADGTLDGIGTVGAVVNNGGTIRGSVRMSALTLGGGSTIEAVLNGDTPVSGYSQLNVPGAVDLNNATLQVSLGYAPSIGQSFTILSAGTLNGQFANDATIAISYGDKAYLLAIAIDGNNVVLTVMPQGSVIMIR